MALVPPSGLWSIEKKGKHTIIGALGPLYEKSLYGLIHSVYGR